MIKTNAEKFFSNINQNTIKRYVDYWKNLRPKTSEDFLRRYLFAITSVHTNWAGNVRGYNALKDLDWMHDKELLRQRLIEAKCGMYNGRTDNIWKFTEQFYENTAYYCQVPLDWTTYRNDLVNKIKGLGVAKVSFTLEMCFPIEAELSCIDTHGIQLYELDYMNFQTRKGLNLYEEIEKHWLKLCENNKVPSYIARCIFWDKKQNRRNTRYWSHVLEN